MSSRDVILGRIRTALAERRADKPLPPVHPVWPRQNPSAAALAEQFEKELVALRGELLRFPSLAAARQGLAEMIAREGWKQIAAVDRPACRELCAELPADQTLWAVDSWTPASMADFSAGLLAAEFFLADTGSCVIVSGTAQERLLTYLPPVCLVVGRTQQLVEHLPAAWEALSARASDPATRGEFVLVTGPSRTSDIEKILIHGVHGPKRLIVILID